MDCLTKCSRAQSTDAAKHSREITLVIESNGQRDVLDLRPRYLQECLCFFETDFVDQCTVCEATGGEPSGQGALRDIHDPGRKPSGRVAIGQIRLEYHTKRIYEVPVADQKWVIHYTTLWGGVAYRFM